MKKTSSLIIRIYGIVQGVGFRPFVSRIADRFGIKGSVSNKGSYVEVHAQGTDKALQAFLTALENEPPERSTILKIDVNETDEKAAVSFEIIESEKEAGDIFVSPDIATCDKCKQELFDKNNRRYLHPFINCTNGFRASSSKGLSASDGRPVSPPARGEPYIRALPCQDRGA